MRSRATKIQELTKTFREAQRNYLQNMKEKEQRGRSYIDNESIEATLPNLAICSYCKINNIAIATSYMQQHSILF